MTLPRRPIGPTLRPPVEDDPAWRAELRDRWASAIDANPPPAPAPHLGDEHP